MRLPDWKNFLDAILIIVLGGLFIWTAYLAGAAMAEMVDDAAGKYSVQYSVVNE